MRRLALAGDNAVNARKPALALALAAAALVPAAALAGGTTTITVKLAGKVEVPKGASAGSGTATVTLDPNAGKVCWKISVSGIGKPTAAHIHQAAAGKAGGVVVALGGAFKPSGCVKVGSSAVKPIAKNPGGYYVNVHTAAFPNGAVRGQLGSSSAGGSGGGGYTRGSY